MVVSIRLDRGQKIPAALLELKKELRDWRPLWRSLKPDLSRELRQGIDTEGSSIGAEWKPLTPGYARRKKGPRPGIESGRLRKAAGRTGRLSKGRLVRDVRIPYAKYFHGGGRPFVAFGRQLESEVYGQAEKRLDALLTDAARKGSA